MQKFTAILTVVCILATIAMLTITAFALSAKHIPLGIFFTFVFLFLAFAFAGINKPAPMPTRYTILHSNIL